MRLIPSIPAVALGVLMSAALVASTQVLASAAVTGNAAAAVAVVDYDDPVTDRPVTRLTTDGADGCLNYMGNLAGEATSWSPDSTLITYAKSCDDNPERTGVYVFELDSQTETCLASTGRHWAYPIFDHGGDTIYFIDGSDGPRDEQQRKPFAVRTIDLPVVLDGQPSCPDAATTVLDIRAESSVKVDDAVVMTRNHAPDPADALFGVQLRVGSTWRTVVFDPDGQTTDSWGFDDQTNPLHGDRNDGDASIWSPTDPSKIFTNRGTSASDTTVQRGVWTIDVPTLLYQPFAYDPECSGDYRPSTGVAHSDWEYHAGTDTDVFMSSDRCVWMIDGADQVSLGPWRLHGYLHLNIDQTSVDGDLGDIRFVADEYFKTDEAEPFLYSATLADLGVGGEAIGRWSDIRRERKLVGHRNRLDDGTNNDLKAFEPHPQFSPDGRHVLWQSNSLNEVAGFVCPEADCGAAGGDDGRLSFLDLYVVALDGPSDGEPPTDLPPVGGEVMHVVSCLSGNGRVDTNIVNPQADSANYRIEFEGLSPRANEVAGGDWWRMPITGRLDGDYTVVVRRAGIEVASTTLTVNCDVAGEDSVEVSAEVQVVSACRNGDGYLLFQFVNQGATNRGWVIEFAGVPNRSTSAAGYAQSVRAVTGRSDGDHGVRIRTDGVVSTEFTVTVNCD